MEHSANKNRIPAKSIYQFIMYIHRSIYIIVHPLYQHVHSLMQPRGGRACASTSTVNSSAACSQQAKAVSPVFQMSRSAPGVDRVPRQRRDVLRCVEHGKGKM